MVFVFNSKKEMTMKKIYMSPDMFVVNVQVAKMIATSDPKPQVLDDTSDPIEDSNEVGSRRYSAWDDEELEEEDY